MTYMDDIKQYLGEETICPFSRASMRLNHPNIYMDLGKHPSNHILPMVTNINAFLAQANDPRYSSLIFVPSWTPKTHEETLECSHELCRSIVLAYLCVKTENSDYEGIRKVLGREIEHAATQRTVAIVVNGIGLTTTAVSPTYPKNHSRYSPHFFIFQNLIPQLDYVSKHQTEFTINAQRTAFERVGHPHITNVTVLDVNPPEQHLPGVQAGNIFTLFEGPAFQSHVYRRRFIEK